MINYLNSDSTEALDSEDEDNYDEDFEWSCTSVQQVWSRNLLRTLDKLEI
jgi:hypothetical protein